MSFRLRRVDRPRGRPDLPIRAIWAAIVALWAMTLWLLWG